MYVVLITLDGKPLDQVYIRKNLKNLSDSMLGKILCDVYLLAITVYRSIYKKSSLSIQFDKHC